MAIANVTGSSPASSVVTAAAAPMLQSPCLSPRPRLCWLLFQPNPPLHPLTRTCEAHLQNQEMKKRNTWEMGITNHASSGWDVPWELCFEARRYDHLSCYSFGESSELLLTSTLTVRPSGQCAQRLEDKLITNWMQKETAEPTHRRSRPRGIPPPIPGSALGDSAPKCRVMLTCVPL